MFSLANAHRSIVTLASALLVSTLCITAAVGPVKAAAPIASDAGTPAR